MRIRAKMACMSCQSKRSARESAGLGTVLGQVASGALALGFYLRGVGMPIEVRPNAASCCDTYAVALPVILTELSDSIMMFVLGGVAGRTDPLFALIMGTAGVSWACLAFVAGDVCAALHARALGGGRSDALSARCLIFDAFAAAQEGHLIRTRQSRVSPTYRSAASQGRLVRSWEAVSFAVTGS